MRGHKVFLICLLLAVFPSIALAATFEVDITDSGFTPAFLAVTKGDTVRWTNVGTTSHSVTSGFNGVPDNKFDSGLLEPEATFEHTFSTIDLFSYFDRTNLRSGGIEVQGNELIISPRDSMFLDTFGFPLIIFTKVSPPTTDFKITINYNDSIIFDDKFPVFLGLTGGASSNFATVDGRLATVISVPPLHQGTHKLTITITTPAGPILTDQVTYTVIGQIIQFN